MAVVVLSVGGSLLNPGTPDTAYARRLAATLTAARAKLAVLTGGGKSARTYADAIRAAGGSEFAADEAAILATRQNALLLVSALGAAAHPCFSLTFDAAARAALSGRIVVMGGTIPGITTDADAALLAEKLGAVRLVNLSNIAGIYDADPRTNPKAKRYSTLSYARLIELATEADKRRAGENFVFDLLACKIIARSRIEAHFIDGRDFASVTAAIAGKPHAGTVVR